MVGDLLIEAVVDSESRTPASRYIAKRTFRFGVSKGRVVMTHEVNCSVLFLGASDLFTPRNVDVTLLYSTSFGSMVILAVWLWFVHQ